MEDNIQLKEEEVVGDEVVLTDIYPKTNTNSVVDSSSGRQLNETIDFIWQRINNKLSRVVNSVNNRTGVVVLNSEDVGLGNVDNVSFADIKQWVIDLLVQEFGNKRIYLAEYLDEIDNLIKEPYDLTHRDQPFFSRYGYRNANDKKSYIGYIYYDTSTKSLKVSYKAIRVVGSTDQSLLYNNDNGNLKLHIWSGQDVIRVRDTGVTEDSGVYLDEDEMYRGIRYFDSIYDFLWNDPINGTTYSHGINKPGVTGNYQVADICVWTESNKSTSVKYRSIGTVDVNNTDKFRIGQIVYCAFRTTPNSNGTIPSNMIEWMMNREPGFGMVVRDGIADPESRIRIVFFPSKQNLGWGLKNVITLRNKLMDPSNPYLDPGTSDTALDLKLASYQYTKHCVPDTSESPYDYTLTSNVSGLQVVAGPASRNPYDNTKVNVDDGVQYTNFPSGQVQIFNKAKQSGGLYINPDSSMCIIPLDSFSSYARNPILANWRPSIPNPNDSLVGRFARIDDLEVEMNGVLNRPSYLGINLTKAIFDNPDTTDENTDLASLNISGLRINNQNAADAVTGGPLRWDWFGMNYGELEERYGTTLKFDPTSCQHSGGISVNVGKFLEIDPGQYHAESQDWYNGGKVNVRIGNGLEAEPDKFDSSGRRIAGNKIQLKLSAGGKLKFDDNGSLIVTNVIDAVVTLNIVDSYDSHFEYNPIPETEGNKDIARSTITLNLGKGLKLSDGSSTIDMEAYRNKMNKLTVDQLIEYLPVQVVNTPIGAYPTGSGEYILGYNVKTALSKKAYEAETHYSSYISDMQGMDDAIRKCPVNTGGNRSAYMTLDQGCNYVLDKYDGNAVRVGNLALWYLADEMND